MNQVAVQEAHALDCFSVGDLFMKNVLEKGFKIKKGDIKYKNN